MAHMHEYMEGTLKLPSWELKINSSVSSCPFALY